MIREPVFIVGVQRSGTTLLSAMLAAHSKLSCGPETHFFRRLSGVDVGQVCDPDRWPMSGAEFIWSISHTGVQPGSRKTLLEKYQLDKDSVLAYLEEKEPSVPNLLRSVTEQYMKVNGKRRWVEKTPDHLLYLDSVREHFPESPIIRIVRDPRDVALSLMNVPWGVKSLLEGLQYWERLHSQSDGFVASDGRCHTVRFEDLVSSPVETLRAVCRFIDEDFEDGMLDTSTTGRQINSRNAPWKAKVSQAVDSSRVAVWRSELPREENCLAEAVLGDRIAALGYPREEVFSRVGEVRGGVLESRHAPALAAIASSGVRFWKTNADETAGVKVYLGAPVSMARADEGARQRLSAAGAVLRDVARAIVSDSENELYWIPEGSDREWTGWVSHVLKKLLMPYRAQFDASSPSHRAGSATGDWSSAGAQPKNLG